MHSTRLVLNDVCGRLRALLASLAQPLADGTQRVAERLTHQATAHRPGCSREMVSRWLKDLERGGYIAVQDHRFVLVRALPARW